MERKRVQRIKRSQRMIFDTFLVFVVLLGEVRDGERTSTANKEKPPNDIRCVLGIRCTLYSGEGKRVQRIRRNQRMMFNTFLLFVVLIMAWRERTSTANKEKPTNDVRCVLGIRCT